MRKLLLITFLFLIFSSSYSKGPLFSKWSLTAETGINQFDGDITQQSTAVFPTSSADFTSGLSLEYNLTPIWGLAMNYYYMPIMARTNPGIDVKTKLQLADFSATINFTKLIFPQSKSRFFVNGSVGLGFSYYKYDLEPSTSMLDPGYGQAGTVPVAFSIEYNFSKPFALGTKLQYVAFTKDNLEGIDSFHGVTNDFIAVGTVFLRYKFNSKKKNHLRNITMNDFDPNEALVMARETAEKLKKVDKSVQNLDKSVQDLGKKVADQGRRIDSVYVFMSNDGTDTDGDGVPDHRDMDNATPANTAVDFWGRPIILGDNNVTNIHNINNNNTSIYYDDSTPAVYFDFDQITLDDEALVTISKMANKLKKDPTLFVEVRGYCDYLGNNPYNDKLSKRRADRVKAELVKVWHIPADHIIANGKGKILEPRIQYRPNRRCDFFFSKE